MKVRATEATLSTDYCWTGRKDNLNRITVIKLLNWIILVDNMWLHFKSLHVYLIFLQFVKCNKLNNFCPKLSISTFQQQKALYIL